MNNFFFTIFSEFDILTADNELSMQKMRLKKFAYISAL